ncbi:hypothetical protein E2C01_055412 [Portunus trituberculatus]|uniref:Uncharacterized protein n=1 Tax=Portunus trituberculatus TaxID=210409 RepID=A0A5B7GMM0_PORTR|nr:hypothetical protein [Portunus trituberculatus]
MGGHRASLPGKSVCGMRWRRRWRVTEGGRMGRGKIEVKGLCPHSLPLIYTPRAPEIYALPTRVLPGQCVIHAHCCVHDSRASQPSPTARPNPAPPHAGSGDALRVDQESESRPLSIGTTCPLPAGDDCCGHVAIKVCQLVVVAATKLQIRPSLRGNGTLVSVAVGLHARLCRPRGNPRRLLPVSSIKSLVRGAWGRVPA